MFEAIGNFIRQFETFEIITFSGVLLFFILLSFYAVWQSYLAEKYKNLFQEISKEAKRFHKLKNTFQTELKTFADLLDEINFPIWQRDKNLKIVYCNSKYCEITGEIRERILETGDLELYKNSHNVASKAIKTGQTQVTEQFVVISGTSTLCQIVEIPVSDKSYGFNAKTGTIGFALNLHELQATRERLKFSNELQNRLVESLNNAIAIYGTNKRLEYFNQAFVNMWKLDADWLKKSPTYSEILDVLREKRKLPEQIDFVNFKKENDAMFNNLFSKKEDYYYLPDNSVYKVVIIPYQQRGLLFYYENVTEEFRLESEYNTLVSVQKQTLDNLNEAVAVFGEDGRLKLFNPSYSEIWGHSPSLLHSEPHIKELLAEEKYLYSFNNWEEFVDNSIEKLQKREISENKIIRTDGVVLLQRITPLPNGGTLITYFDITDKENVEKSLRAEKKAYEEADKIKTNFLSNVSYELRSPLTSIMGFTEILMMEYFEKIGVKTKDYLKSIFDSSVKLKNLIDNIIEVSSIDAGFVNISREPFSIKEEMVKTLPNLENEAERKKVKLSYKIPSENIAITGDKDRIFQAIKTLINQAISSASAKNDNKGKVDFLVSNNNNFIRFEIIDNGNPISKDDLPLIFDQFYRAHSDSISNNGIGLYLTKRIVELHNGFITAESENNQNKFTFEIPRNL
ncbi:MAG: PAS-domain containing protein [Rickettsiales bacterium]|nr:PAS-domain containing protein [Rickettsiales bacterium]